MKRVLKIFQVIPLRFWLATAALGIFVWLWIFGNQGLNEWENLRRTHAQLLDRQTQLLKERQMLKEELKQLKDPRHQKYLVHKELGYVAPNEVLIKFKKAGRDISSPAPNKSAAKPAARQD